MAQTFSEFIDSPQSKKPHFFVIGHPISHSLSPLMHNTALHYYGIDASYYAIDVMPDELSSFIAWVNEDIFLGCNITLPYKKQLSKFVDRKSDTASVIGAINTVYKQDGVIIGDNTDVYGFLQPLLPFEDLVEGTDAVVFGTGGASGAIVQGLKSLGARKVYLVTRNPGTKRSVDPYTEYIGYAQWGHFMDEVSIVVNTTPLGMYPNTDQSPVRESEVQLLKDKICYDLVYNPLNTLFIQQSKPVAEQSITGIDMLIQQGNRSFQIWTGEEFPVDIVKRRLIDYFKSI